jgi:hypothetical protein
MTGNVINLIGKLPLVYINIPAQSITAGTPVSILAGSSGVRIIVLAYALSLSVAGEIIFKDGTNEVLRTPALLAGTPFVDKLVFPDIMGGKALTMNNALQLDVSATGTVNGYVIAAQQGA